MEPENKRDNPRRKMFMRGIMMTILGVVVYSVWDFSVSEEYEILDIWTMLALVVFSLMLMVAVEISGSLQEERAKASDGISPKPIEMGNDTWVFPAQDIRLDYKMKQFKWFLFSGVFVWISLFMIYFFVAIAAEFDLSYFEQGHYKEQDPLVNIFLAIFIILMGGFFVVMPLFGMFWPCYTGCKRVKRARAFLEKPEAMHRDGLVLSPEGISVFTAVLDQHGADYFLRKKNQTHVFLPWSAIDSWQTGVVRQGKSSHKAYIVRSATLDKALEHRLNITADYFKNMAEPLHAYISRYTGKPITERAQLFGFFS